MPVHRTLPLSLLLLCGSSPSLHAQRPDPLAISVEELGARLRHLSSDLFEGRAPGTRGEQLTLGYLVSELEAFGVRPGAGDGWLQPVDITVHDPDSTSPNSYRLSGRVTGTLEHGRDMRPVANSARAVVEAGGELVFVGYGISAPMYGWDDFAGIDLTGKVAVALLGEPPSAADSSRFNGVRASRYGWARDKVAEMDRRGAVGVLWMLPQGRIARTSVGGNRRLAPDAERARTLFTGLITDSTVARLLPAGGPSLAELRAAADRPGFRGLPLGVRLDVAFRTRPRQVRSHNVIGIIGGTDPARAREHVVLSAHWDAFGIGRPVNGDSIYNGALDDGSGLTALLANARVLARAPQPRPITFLFTTAEEWGLLGAEAFVCAGPIAATHVVANLNVDDGIELLGRKRDAAPLGVEFSTLGRTIAAVAKRHGLRVSPDPYPQEGFFLRADNYPFARAGVPALYMGLGTDTEGRGTAWTDSLVADYLQRHYHQPSDDYATVAIDLRGAQQFAEFLRDVTVAVARDPKRPEWLPGAEFRRDGDETARACGAR
ncbi:MAG: M28 family peptidase [Gemmatimonadales bacterium]|jgi:hypothetical protein|nr:M28 family peptidase [Gemmatimonadales bacterium]